jgi:hypothetical protein
MVRAEAPAFLNRAYDTWIDLFVIIFTNLAVWRAAISAIGWVAACVASPALGQHDPCDPGNFRCEGHDDFVPVHASLQLSDPGAKPIFGAVEVQDTGASAVDQQTTQVFVAALAYAEQGRLATS